MARAELGRLLLLLSLPLAALPSTPPGRDKRGGDPEALHFVSEYFSQSAQKLSFYSWYGNAKLFRFRVPEDTVLLRWLLQVSKGIGPECSPTQVTMCVHLGCPPVPSQCWRSASATLVGLPFDRLVPSIQPLSLLLFCSHFSYGAPPVINPLGTQFPSNMCVRPSYNQTLILGAALQNSTLVNLTSPAAGDWFLSAHLPEANGKIEVKGFFTQCTYIFQPDLFVLRLADVSILEPDVPMWQTITQSRLIHAKIFVPEYSATLRFVLKSCTTNASMACAVRVTLGSATLPQSFQKVLDCTGNDACSVLLASPPWEKWLRITVESLSGRSTSVSFEMTASFTACKPGGAGSFLNFYKNLNLSQEIPLQGVERNTTLPATADARNASGPSHSCLHSQPVIREEIDVVSVHFRVLGESGVPVQTKVPTVLLLYLDSSMDSGGTLVVNLLWNATSVYHKNATIMACLSATSPVLSPGAASWGCQTAFSQGYLRNLTTSSMEATLAVPYPESDNWFLSLQLICPRDSGDCENIVAQTVVLAYLSPCWDDCGIYGQCNLLRRYSYLYAACSCKAGWSGWSCTDGTRAQSLGTQMLATLLLTLSNLLFLPAITIALHRYHLVEASVYIFTMFFSTFYHACDQPGMAVLCIMGYDTLQFCDFLGSVVSIWVTILCMARVKKILKYVLCVSGTLIIAMSLQLDRRGMWNMLGPCIFALVIMTTAWAYRGVKRHRCYPPCWHRWAFFLVPGIGLAVVAIAVYAFMETKENYYYTHSIWHILVASSVAFLLPPGDKHKKSWAWSRELLCRYQICKNDREELYAVT